jgi:hypothetical protein
VEEEGEGEGEDVGVTVVKEVDWGSFFRKKESPLSLALILVM